MLTYGLNRQFSGKNMSAAFKDSINNFVSSFKNSLTSSKSISCDRYKIVLDNETYRYDVRSESILKNNRVILNNVTGFFAEFYESANSVLLRVKFKEDWIRKYIFMTARSENLDSDFWEV